MGSCHSASSTVSSSQNKAPPLRKKPSGSQSSLFLASKSIIFNKNKAFTINKSKLIVSKTSDQPKTCLTSSKSSFPINKTNSKLKTKSNKSRSLNSTTTSISSASSSSSTSSTRGDPIKYLNQTNETNKSTLSLISTDSIFHIDKNHHSIQTLSFNPDRTNNDELTNLNLSDINKLDQLPLIYIDNESGSISRDEELEEYDNHQYDAGKFSTSNKAKKFKKNEFLINNTNINTDENLSPFPSLDKNQTPIIRTNLKFNNKCNKQHFEFINFDEMSNQQTSENIKKQFLTTKQLNMPTSTQVTSQVPTVSSTNTTATTTGAANRFGFKPVSVLASMPTQTNLPVTNSSLKINHTKPINFTSNHISNKADSTNDPATQTRSLSNSSPIKSSAAKLSSSISHYNNSNNQTNQLAETNKQTKAHVLPKQNSTNKTSSSMPTIKQTQSSSLSSLSSASSCVSNSNKPCHNNENISTNNTSLQDNKTAINKTNLEKTSKLTYNTNHHPNIVANNNTTKVNSPVFKYNATKVIKAAQPVIAPTLPATNTTNPSSKRLFSPYSKLNVNTKLSHNNSSASNSPPIKSTHEQPVSQFKASVNGNGLKQHLNTMQQPHQTTVITHSSHATSNLKYSKMPVRSNLKTFDSKSSKHTTNEVVNLYNMSVINNGTKNEAISSNVTVSSCSNPKSKLDSAYCSSTSSTVSSQDAVEAAAASHDTNNNIEHTSDAINKITKQISFLNMSYQEKSENMSLDVSTVTKCDELNENDDDLNSQKQTSLNNNNFETTSVNSLLLNSDVSSLQNYEASTSSSANSNNLNVNNTENNEINTNIAVSKSITNSQIQPDGIHNQKNLIKQRSSIRDSIGELNQLMMISSSSMSSRDQISEDQPAIKFNSKSRLTNSISACVPSSSSSTASSSSTSSSYAVCAQMPMFKPPSNLPPVENSEVIQLDIETYRLIMQDLQNTKTILYKLANILREPSANNNQTENLSQNVIGEEFTNNMQITGDNHIFNTDNPLVSSFYNYHHGNTSEVICFIEKNDQSTQTDT